MTSNEKFVYENYTIKSTKEISIILNITQQSVRRIASNLGVTKRKKVLEELNLTDIPNFSNYGVDESHRVIRKKDNIIISTYINNDGYTTLRLTDDNGKRRTLQYHRLLAIIFLNPEGDDIDVLQVNHMDGIKSNNKLENLEWVTPSENLKHAYDNGLRNRSVGNVKYSNEQINRVCEFLEIYKSPKKVYDLLKGEVNKVVIQQIYNKRRWDNISKDYNF